MILLGKNAGTTQGICVPLEQILEAAPIKQLLYGYLPLISQTIQTRTSKTCLALLVKGELISDVLLETLSYGHTRADRSPKIYSNKIYEDTRYRLEDSHDRWELKESVRSARLMDDYDDDIFSLFFSVMTNQQIFKVIRFVRTLGTLLRTYP